MAVFRLLRQTNQSHWERIDLGEAACFSTATEFSKTVKAAVDRHPDLKRTFEHLRKSAESLSQRSRSTAEEIKRTANEAAEQATEQVKAASGYSQNGQQQSPADSFSAFKNKNARDQFSSGFESTDSNFSRAESSENASSSKGDNKSSAAKPGLGARLKNAFAAIRKEVEEAVLPRHTTASATRARDPSIKPAGNPGTSALTAVKEDPSRWQRHWAEMQDKLGSHAVFQRLRSLSDNPVFNKSREVAEDLRGRWETSDSAFVQKIQDMRDNMFTETEQAQALREIRQRYPGFDMMEFIHLVKEDVPVVIRGYLQGDLPVLQQHCSKEMMERFSGIIAAQKAEGLVSDSTILDISEVGLVDLKFVDGSPVVIVQFSCQQINCTRDRFGNVVEGGPQDIQRVFYYWALAQDDAGFYGEDGKFHPPRWQLTEMLIRGMHNLL